VRFASSLALGLGLTSTVRRRNTSGIRSTSKEVSLAHGLTRRLIGTVTGGCLVALPRSAVAKIGRREAGSLAFGKGHTFAGGTARNALEVRAANIAVAGLVLVVLGASPLLKTGRRHVRVLWLTSAVRSLCSVFIDYRNRTPAAQIVH